MNEFTNQVKVQQLFPLSNRIIPHSNTNKLAYSEAKAPNREKIKFPAVYAGVTYPSVWSTLVPKC